MRRNIPFSSFLLAGAAFALLLATLRPESGDLLLSGWRLTAPTTSSPAAK